MIGVYYYPEQWPESQWERDITNIKHMGMAHIHMAEFAWIHLEPEEGRYQFDWLDRSIELADKVGLKVILCTPTTTPPIWMSQTYPEISMVLENGRRAKHGSRAQRCVNSPLFNRFAIKIAEKMARRYGHHPSVIGWQIDNEVGHYQKAPCYCDACHDAFINYLKERYQTIEALNQAWGGDFWSQNYQDFSQISLPNPEEMVYVPNEHALLDFRRFFSFALSAFIEKQAETIKPFLKNGAWITHNFRKTDPFHFPGHVKQGLDLYTLTIYPVSGHFKGKPGRELHRLGNAYETGYMHDFTRSFNGRWGIMEQQPGQVNWGPHNLRPYPGTTRLWLWTAIGHGAELLDTYRYRQPRCGAEQYHEGLVGLDGVNLTLGGKNFKQVAAELASLEPLFEKAATKTMKKAALLVDWDSQTAIDIHPQNTKFDCQRTIEYFYRGLKQLGMSVDIIYQDALSDLSRYDVVCSALVDLVDETLLEDWKRYVENGGHLVLSPRTATRNRQGHFPEHAYAGWFNQLTGERLSGYDVMPEGHAGKINLRHNQKEITWDTWAEQFEIGPDAELLAVHDDQFYQGTAAAFKRKSGNGTMTAIGFDQGDGIAELMAYSLKQELPDLPELEENTLFSMRGAAGIFTNYNDHPVTVPQDVAEGGRLMIGDQKVAPAGIAIFDFSRDD